MRLYLDDVRPCPPGYVLAQTAPDAIGLLKTGQVTVISFDHDLGPTEAGTGYDVACWIETQAHTSPGFQVPSYQIHSANPVGRNNIHNAMVSARFAAMDRLHPDRF